MRKTRCHYSYGSIVPVIMASAFLGVVLPIRASGENGKMNAAPDIFVAAANGDLEIIKDFIAEGGSPNVRRPYDGTMLFYAVKNHNAEAVKFLLENRADPFHGKQPGVEDNSPQGEDITPLECLKAEKTKKPDLAALLDEIAPLLERACAEIERREERITMAIGRNDVQAVVAELRGGCVRRHVYKECYEFSLKQADDRLFLDLMNYYDFSVYPGSDSALNQAPLSPETKRRFLDLLKERRNNQMYAAFKYLMSRELDMAQLNSLEFGSRSMLMNASASGNLQLVKYLLQLGADPNVADKTGRRAIDYVSADSPHKKEIELLLSARK